MDDQELSRLSRRLDKVETKMDQFQEWASAKETQYALLKVSLNHIETDMGKINNHIAKVVWLVLIGILTAIGSFILKGGLNGVT